MIYNSEQIYAAALELKRRAEHTSSNYVPGNVPGWDQLSFHKSIDRYRLLFGGNQSGKSYTAAFEISCWARGKHPYRPIPSSPVEIWVISVEYATLQSGIFRHLKELIPDWEVERYGPNVPLHNLPSHIQLKNGSAITFKSAKGEDAARSKFQAAAVDLISIDEEVRHNIWEELEARTLKTGGQFIISATLIESFEWILRLEDLAERGTPGYFVTRLNTDKNPYLHQETVQRLSKQWSEETLDVRFRGKSRRATGLIYNTWDDIKHKIPKFDIPKEWPRWCAIDPGIRTFAVLWITVDPDNHAYAYREIYAHGEPLWQIAISIRIAEGFTLAKQLSYQYEHFVWEPTESAEIITCRIIDDKRGSRLITGDQGVLDQLYNRYGILCTPADKLLRPGIEDIRHWLEPLVDGKPGFRCFDHLENFLNERRSYHIRPRESKKHSSEPIEDPVKKADHLMDCWRYIAREKPQFRDKFIIEGTPNTKLYGIAEINDRIKKKKELVHEFLGTEW